MEHCEECLLRNLHGTHLFHPLLSFFLLLEQLAFARDVAAVALREHVLSERLHGCARDDFLPDRCLYDDLKKLARNKFLQLVRDLSAPLGRLVPVNDHGERINRIPVDEHIELDEFASPVLEHLVIE